MKHLVERLRTLCLILALAGSWASFDGDASAAEDAGTDAVAITGIQVSFRLDPRVTRGMYMGDRWISPPTYLRVGLPDMKEVTMTARATVLDSRGRPMAMNPEWIPADPDMVAVSPAQGRQVTITVKRAGQSRLKVASDRLTKKLLIQAIEKNNALHVEISQ